MAPIAAVVAGAEPEMAEKTSAASTVTIASPPVRWRTSVPAKSTSRCDRPPAVISSPASMKSGIASRLN